MLAKEECKEALDYLFDNALDNDYMSILDSKMYDILEQLIDEHFDNSPLKFEELKPNMWVWDNVEKEYIQLIYHDYGYSQEWLYIQAGNPYETEFIFEENRFYRKMVE